MAGTWQRDVLKALMVGELHCPRCKRVMDVKVGGVQATYNGVVPKWYCPACGGWTGNYWVNEIRDWESRDCLFLVDERVE